MRWNPLTWFPFTKDGRATLIYIGFFGSMPVLSAIIVYVLYTIRWFDAPAIDRLERFYQIGMRVTLAFLLGTLIYGAFISFRAFHAGKDGIGINSKDDADGAQQTANAAQDKATEIAEKAE